MLDLDLCGWPCRVTCHMAHSALHLKNFNLVIFQVLMKLFISRLVKKSEMYNNACHPNV